MHVGFYTTERLYGFAETEDTRVFFHLGVFVAGHWPGLTLAPPPILGEAVQVTFNPLVDNADPDRAPKATQVERLHAPISVHGTVETFNPMTGWGWARGDDGESYYLHRSDVEDGRLPLPDQTVAFYRGRNRGRLRACHARVGRVNPG